MLRGREVAKIMTFVRGITNPADLKTKDSTTQYPVAFLTFGQRRLSLAIAIGTRTGLGRSNHLGTVFMAWAAMRCR